MFKVSQCRMFSFPIFPMCRLYSSVERQCFPKKIANSFPETGKAQPLICPHRFLKNCRFYNYTGSQPSNLQQIY